MSEKHLIFLFVCFFSLWFGRIESYVYNYCKTDYCSSGCCNYTSPYYIDSEEDCSSSSSCSCVLGAFSSVCKGYTSQGYHSCDYCSTGCCYYYSGFNYSDPNCASPYCSYCSSSSICESYSSNTTNSTILIEAGYHVCSGCSSLCCYYSSSLTYLDLTCSSSVCSCASSVYLCTTETTTSVGYHNCTGCDSGCCYYSIFLTSLDLKCNSYYCSCASSSYCQYNSSSSNSSNSSSTGYTSSGYHYCSGVVCSSGCCYYSYSVPYSDYYCTSTYCSCASYYNGYTGCSSNYYNNYYDDAYNADVLTRVSGTTYVVVNYAAWKAIVGVGAAIAGIWFFLILYLIYYKCFHKPHNWAKPAYQMPGMPPQNSANVQAFPPPPGAQTNENQASYPINNQFQYYGQTNNQYPMNAQYNQNQYNQNMNNNLQEPPIESGGYNY